MITEKELCKAIEECQEEPITGTKRSALADLFIIYDHLFGKPDLSGYSYDYNPENTIYTNGGTEFLQIVNGKDTEKVLSIMDELMEATKTLHPRMYDGVLQRIYDI
jgi:hypothetical protein